MTVHSIDNRLDNSYADPSVPLRWSLSGHWQTGPNSGDVVTLSRWLSSELAPDGPPGVTIYFKGGATATTGNTGLFTLRPAPDTAAPGSSLMPITPGGKLRASFKAGMSGQRDAFNGGRLMARFWFVGADGDYIGEYFDLPTVTAPHISSDHMALSERVVDAPEDAHYAYGTIYMVDPGTEPVTSSKAFYISGLYFGPADPSGAVAEVGAATAERLGVISEVSARSKARFPLTLAELPEHFRSGESVEMAAAGRAASTSVWRWRQVSGPPVTLERHGGLARFIAPDVSSPTPIRVAVMASSVDGASRSDWYFYDFTITPALARFRAAEELESVPTLPAIVGYERGKRRIWGDALPPPGMPGRKDTEIIDLGIPDGDVQISEEFPQSAPAGGLHINPVTGDVHRNFGGGYNESGDTLGAPRRSAYWLASEGNIFKWSED